MKLFIALISGLALMAPLAQAQPFIPDANTFGLWHFDEAPGTFVAFDASGNGYNMALQNGAQFSGSAGYYDSGVDLTDPDARVASIWTVGNGWTALTIDAYIYATQINNDEHPIVCRTDFWNIDEVSYYFHVRENGSIAGGVWMNEVGTQSAEAISAPNVIQTGQWYRVAMTWSSGQPVRIFVNDMTAPLVTGTESPDGYIRNSDDPLLIGCNWYQIYGWFYWQGYIDEVRISDVDRYPTAAAPAVEISLDPINPPIIIPQAGGSFSFNAEVENVSGASQIFDVWCAIEVPGGSQLMALGPLSLTLNAGASLVRLRTQAVPANAPGGLYVYWGFVGDHPWYVMNADSFAFSKQGTDGGWRGPDGWVSGGEPFPSEGLTAADNAVPGEFAFVRAHPNPFNPTTKLTFALPAAARVRLSIYDIQGREITVLVDGFSQAGVHEASFDAGGLPSGIYCARLQTGSHSAAQKIVLLK